MWHKTILLKLNNQTLPTTKHLKILVITLDGKLAFLQHINIIITKAKQMLNILTELTSTKEVKKGSNSLYIQCYHLPYFRICKHHMEPIISNTNIKKLQTISNTALQITSGYTQDTNIQHHTMKPRSFQ